LLLFANDFVAMSLVEAVRAALRGGC